MKKPGQSVKIKTATVNGIKKLVSKNFTETAEVRSFTIISVPSDNNENYSIMIDDDLIGWTINSFHVNHLGISKNYLGKKFYDVDETYFI